MKPLILPKRSVLSRIAVFNGLSSSELSEVERFVYPVIVKANCPLLRAGETGEWGYFIHEGTVRIFRPQSSGSDIILNMVGAGDMLGEICALDQQGHSASALATETTALLKMRRGEFCALEESLPLLSKNIKSLLTQRLRFCTTHNESLAVREVHLRVARLLLALSHRYAAEPNQKTVPIPLRLTQREVSDWGRVSRQHADKHLAQLCQCGVLQINKRHRMIVLDVPHLSQHCD